MAKRRQVIEIFAPTAGLKSISPTTIMEPRSQPDAQNGKMYYGFNQKEYGTSLYATGSGSALGAPINFLFEAQYSGGNVLEAFTHTSVNKYSSGSDAFVNDGQTFTGTLSDYWSGVMHNDQFFYTNGVDPIQYKASVSATGTNMVSAVTTTTYKAYALASFREHLCLYRTIEAGTERFKRCRWTLKGILTPQTGTSDFDDGTAGFVDVQDCEGEMKTAQPIGASMAVFSERSIHSQFWVGGTEVFRFQKQVSGIGTPSRRGAKTYKDVVYFVSQDNFHAYHGGDDVRDIGDPIKQYAFSRINNSAIANAFVEVDPQEDEILFHVPTTGELPDTTFVYRINDNAWGKLSRTYTAPGRFTRASGLTIGELIGNIGAQNFKFGDAFVSVEALTRLYGDQSGRVVKVDPSVYSISDSGTSSAQTFLYVTPDLVGANMKDPISGEKVDFTTHNKRYTQVHIGMKGQGTADVAYSIDRGASFTSFPDSPVTLLASGTNHILDVDVLDRQMRVRVTNTGTNEFVGIEYVNVEFIPQGEN